MAILEIINQMFLNMHFPIYNIIAAVILEQLIKCYPNSLSYCTSTGVLHLIFFQIHLIFENAISLMHDASRQSVFSSLIAAANQN